MAKETLEDATNLTPMCPDWYFQMETVAMAQGWKSSAPPNCSTRRSNSSPIISIFTKRTRVIYCRSGMERMVTMSRSGKQMADAVGGPKGDFIYYQIGIVVLGICNCTVQENPLDWARLERGYQAQGEMFKNTNYDANELALLAWRFHDRTVAKQAFEQIGEKSGRRMSGKYRN